MTTIKILGDPHLGRQFVNNVPLHRRGEREATQWLTFQQMLDPQGVDLHICMGDLFDRPIVSYETIFRAYRHYSDVAIANPETEFIVLRGNHDASRDLMATTAFDIFAEMVGWIKNLRVLKDIMVIEYDSGGYAFFPWSPTVSAEEMVRSVKGDGHTWAFGHWDVDPRSDPFNLIPTATLKAQGFSHAYTGHVHLADEFFRDDVKVVVTGSMIAFAHGEGEPYITMSLAEARDADPEELRNKCLRIKLQPGEVFDLAIDCLQLQVERVEGSEEQVAVSLGEFDLHKLFDDVLTEHAVPSSIASQVRSEWDRRFNLGR